MHEQTVSTRAFFFLHKRLRTRLECSVYFTCIPSGGTNLSFESCVTVRGLRQLRA